ncbi:hypothetical protein D3C75_920420 [compost metagenome]
MHVVSNVMQFFRPRLVHCDCSVEPGFAGFVAGEQCDEVFLRHFALFNTQSHDEAFLRTNTVHHDAHAVYQVIELLRYQAELFENFRQLLNLSGSISMSATFRFDGIASAFVLRTQFAEFLTSEFRVDAVVIVRVVVVIFLFVTITIFFCG